MKIHQNNRVKQNTYQDECNQNGENHGNYENHESDGKLPHHRNQLTPESHKRSKPSITYIKKTIVNHQIIKPINAAQIIKTMKNMK